MKLTVEIEKAVKGEAPCTVEVYFDREGLDALLERIDLLKTNKTDHIHLFTPSWGADDEDLTEDRMLDKNDLVHHLKLTMVDGD